MRKSLTLSIPFLLVSTITLHAQQPLSRMEQSENFYDIKAYYETLFSNFENKKEESINHKGEKEETWQDNAWMVFKRWENFYEPRVFPGGGMDYEQKMFSLSRQQETEKVSSLRDFGTNENWSIIGPGTVPQYGGIGRINSIAFNPDDSNIIWVGTASGGLWQSTDSGTTWTTNTDLLPVLGISDIIIDPTNTNIMYIGTGDRDAGDTRSIGILKSVDGGGTWNTTGLSYTTYNFASVYRILLYPEQTNILIAATNTGIYKTEDGGTTWIQTYNGYIRDIEYKPGNDSVIYACNGNQFFISNDLGNTWTESDNGLPLSTSGRMKIAVTPANADYIYILSSDWATWGYNGVYRSTDGGATWSMMSNSPNLMGWDVAGGDTGGQGWYTLSIAVSPSDPNTVYVGGVDIWKSTDGGTNWNCVAHWYGANGVPYVHADIHYLYASDKSTVFTVCDGGIFKTTNSASSWTDLSGNMAITQYYRFSNSATDSNEVIGGAQDNGTSLLSSSIWKEVYGGDGMEALIDFTDENTMYAESQGGYIGRSFDGGANFVGIWPGNGGAWVTPYIIDPNNHKHLIYGDAYVWQTYNYGDTWTQHTDGINNGDLFQSLASAPSNSAVVYAATYSQFFKTTDGGSSWVNMNSFLPQGLPAITYIAVKNTDENTLWITCSGFAAGQKVFVSHDGGYSWQNISDGLPNLPVDCIVYKATGDYNELYAGTDLGVYYKEDYLSDWIRVNTGLPNVIVDELEIQYGAGKLRAATYGRGIWETSLTDPVFFSEDATVESIISPQGFICASTVDPVITIKNYGLDTLHTVQINYSIDNGANNIYNFVGIIPSLESVDIVLPTQIVSAGYHTFRASTDAPNNLTDDFPQNDRDSSTFKFVPSGTVPVSEGFETAGLPPDWEIQNPDGSITWAKINVGAYGLSDSSLYLNLFYYGSIGQLDNLVSPEYDLSSFANALLSFDVADCRYSADYSDSLFVIVSTDCGNTWTRNYSKGGTTLATAPDYTGWFVPGVTQWRHEEVDLTGYLGQKILIAFQCRNGYGNNLFIDNINLNDEALGTNSEADQSPSFMAFPNPASSIVNVEFASSQNTSVQIINALGQLVGENEVKGNQSHTTIDLSNLPAGIYWLIMKSERNVSPQKLVIER